MDRRRIVVLIVALLLPLAGLEARLVHLQLLSGQKYVADPNTRRRSLEVAAAPRGRILDRTGKVLAEDRLAFDLYLVLDEFESDPKTLQRLADALGKPRAELESKIDSEIYRRIERQMDLRPRNERVRILKRERRTPYLLERDIGFDAAFALEVGRAPGVLIREGLRRAYPLGTQPLVGFVGRVRGNEKEYERLLSQGYFTQGFEEIVGEEAVDRLVRKGAFLDDPIGRTGIERACNDLLRGKSGLLIYEREQGREASLDRLVPAVPGRDVDLTVDIEFQNWVTDLIRTAKIEKTTEPTSAAAVVLDPWNGEVLALASFDPQHPEGDSLSHAFQNHYPLGSVFKIVTATVGLENRLMEGPIECTGHFRPTSAFYHCNGTHGPIALDGAMERSCNFYFYSLGEKAGIDGLKFWALQLGLGERTGIDLPAEAKGELADRDVLSFAIGQSGLRVTPLQVAVLMSAVATGGKRVTPHLRRGGGAPPQATALSPATIEELRRVLQDVVHGEHGTAKLAALRDRKAAGKTGSAENVKGKPAHAWFACYVPFDAPKFVVVVFLKNGGHGGEFAAPIAAQILERLMP